MISKDDDGQIVILTGMTMPAERADGLGTLGLMEIRCDFQKSRLDDAPSCGACLPACFYPEELDEVVEDFYEEIFRQELQAWQPDEAYWPDTAHFGLFNRWFRVEAYAEVRDAGRGAIREENL